MQAKEDVTVRWKRKFKTTDCSGRNGKNVNISSLIQPHFITSYIIKLMINKPLFHRQV